MFQSARLKLTLWYVVISMIISAFFSLSFFSVTHNELDRGLHRFERRFAPYALDPEVEERLVFNRNEIERVENQIKIFLFSINLAIFGITALGGYFLSGRVLKPIKEIVEEQKRFISDASHELRTPLTSLKTGIEVNLRDKNLNLSEAKKVLKSNLSDVNNLKNLSDSLLTLSQIANSYNNFHIYNLKEIIGSSIEKIYLLAKAKNIKIINIPTNYYVFGNKDRLIQLFVIFFDNAIKYSRKNDKVAVKSRIQNHKIYIDIIDKGIGIEERDLPFIFDRFYRGDKSRSRSSIDGYGLGLSIAKQILVEHKGLVLVKSKPNLGTTFTIILPLSHN